MTADLTPTRIPGLFGGYRLAWPHIVQYKITEGPRAGQIVDVPPAEKHPDPDSLLRQNRCYRNASVAYMLVIHDPVAYEILMGTGDLVSPQHTGRQRNVPVDKRRTA